MDKRTRKRRAVLRGLLGGGATLAVTAGISAEYLARELMSGEKRESGPDTDSENFSPIAAARQTGVTKSWAMLPFAKADAQNPILNPAKTEWKCPVMNQNVAWESFATYNPAATVRDGKVMMLYRAQDAATRTSRLGLASSDDGIKFTRRPAPVFFPDNDSMKQYEWPGGCEDPRLVEDERGTYYLTYTVYDGKLARLAVATSPDLVSWTKRGLVFANALGGRYKDVWSKSGAIVCRRIGERTVAVKIDGKYWMYWGDTDIYAATSDDLIDWTPIEKPAGQTEPADGGRILPKGYERLARVFKPRAKRFDSDLVEPGPYALSSEAGIHLIYNSRNDRGKGDQNLPNHAYSVGQVLLDKNNPLQVIDRLDGWFLKPDRDFERRGQVNEVVFAEGLVYFKGKWFLYYGTADSRVGLAIHEPSNARRG